MLCALLCLGSPSAQAAPQLVSVATSGKYLLWNNSDGNGAVSLAINVSGTSTYSYYTYGPYQNWSAKSLAVGADGVARLLWTKTDGSAALWRVDSGGGFTQITYGPFSGWTAQSLAVGGNNAPRILWTYTDGTMSLWSVDTQGGYTYQNYGPYAGYTAAQIAVGANNIPRILWNKSDGSISLWYSTADAANYAHTEYGPFSGYTPLSLTTDSGSAVRLLWNHPSDGTTSLWNLPPSGGYTYQNYTNPAGTSPIVVSADLAGAAGSAQVLYSQPDGTARISFLGGGGQVSASTVAPPGGSTGGGGGTGGGGTTTPATPNPHGYYTVLYSGGNLTSSDPNATASYSTGSSSNYEGTSYSGSISGTGYSGAGISVRLSGGVSAKFTWHADPAYPGSPPPAQVTVIERCTSSWAINGYADGVSGQSATGFGQQNGPSSTSGGASSNSVSGIGSASGGGAEFTIQCSPTAFVGGGQGSSYICSRGTVSFDYTAIPVTMNLAGTTFNKLNSTDTMLIGQQCTASLVGLPAALASNVSYSWTVSGTTFHEWRQTTPQVGNNPPNVNASYYDPTTGQLNLPTPNQLVLPTPQWHWNDPIASGEKVTCTATLTPPVGQGTAFPITLSPQTVNVQVPTYNANNSAGTGYVGSYDSNSASIGLYAGATPQMVADKKMQGSTWRTSVTMPAAPSYSGPGYYGYAQLITPGEYLTANDNTEIASDATKAGEGLDDLFPYRAATLTADSTSYDQGDTPAIRLDSSIADANFMAARLSDSFKVYLMFLPPGTGSNWVPLAESEWATNNPDLKANRPASGHWSSFSPTQSVGNVYLKQGFQPWHTHPKWTFVHPASAPFIKQ